MLYVRLSSLTGQDVLYVRLSSLTGQDVSYVRLSSLTGQDVLYVRLSSLTGQAGKPDVHSGVRAVPREPGTGNSE